MKTFFTSDIHFGHKNIIKYCNRPYASPEEMDEGIISNWNALIEKTDTVWVLGDLSFRPADQTVEILSRLNGILKIVLGNHDKVVRDSKLVQGFFNEIHEGFIERIFHDAAGNKHYFVMCHYPMMSWNRSYHGSIHLHGHTHGQIKFDPRYRRLDVGVDDHDMKPIALQDALDKLTSVAVPKDAYSAL